jgi:chromate transport protein ChrA
MLSTELITNMVIGVSIIVGAMMILLVYQIYKNDSGNKGNGDGSKS